MKVEKPNNLVFYLNDATHRWMKAFKWMNNLQSSAELGYSRRIVSKALIQEQSWICAYPAVNDEHIRARAFVDVCNSDWPRFVSGRERWAKVEAFIGKVLRSGKNSGG